MYKDIDVCVKQNVTIVEVRLSVSANNVYIYYLQCWSPSVPVVAAIIYGKTRADEKLSYPDLCTRSAYERIHITPCII